MFQRLCFRLLALLALAAAPAVCQCTFTLTPASASFTNTSNDAVITISASAPNCAWTAKSNTSWITISFGFSGTGNGSVGFTVLQNNTAAQRTGSLTIAGLTFTVSQAAAVCTYALSPATATVPTAGGTGTFTVTTGCAWTATSSAGWLATSSTGTGNGTVSYVASANTTGASRTATITVGTQTFMVTQPAACSFTLNPFSIQAAVAGTTGTFTVTASSTTCPWTAASANPDFISITSGVSGTGNGTVGYAVQANTGTAPRSGSIAVGDTAFGVYQPGGTACSYALSAGSASFSSVGGVGSFTVTSACSWLPVATASWISVANAASITGNGVVTYTVVPNPSATPRSAAITVGGQNITIAQGGLPCTVSVNTTSVQIPSTGVSGIIDVTAPDGCTWNAAASASWITLGATTGTALGTVPYSVPANPTAQIRRASIAIANQTIAIAQDATACAQALTPTSASVAATGGTYTFNVATQCSYSAVSNSGWIKVVNNAMGAATSDVSYSVTANTSSASRSGSISVGAQTLAVTQSGAGCTLSLNPASAVVGAQGGSGSLNVAATGSCAWEPKTDSGWLHFTYAAVNGSGRINFTADPTNQTSARTGNLFVADQVFSITQSSRPAVQFTSDAVLNGATLKAGSVAPGEIITVFGNQIGPLNGSQATLTADGQSITASLAATRVLFDGTPAPLLYVSSSQVSAIVPYEISGQTSTNVQLEYLGFPSASVTIPVALTAPGLFTVDASGSGQGAILNQDASVNSATNPADAGSVIVLFATGEGQTTPAGADGKLAVGKVLPKPVAPVSVTIGGSSATVTYAGAVPGLSAGVLQVNVRVPLTASSGPVPVILRVGSAASPDGVTVFIR